MRASGAPMTAEEFDEALALAIAGAVVTDTGADERTRAALEDIALQGATSGRETAARDAFARSRS